MYYHIFRVIVSDMFRLSYLIKRHSPNYSLGYFIALSVFENALCADKVVEHSLTRYRRREIWNVFYSHSLICLEGMN